MYNCNNKMQQRNSYFFRILMLYNYVVKKNKKNLCRYHRLEFPHFTYEFLIINILLLLNAPKETKNI